MLIQLTMEPLKARNIHTDTHSSGCIFHMKGHTYLTKMFLPVIGISVLDCVIEAVLCVTVTNEKSFNHDVKIDQQTIIPYIRSQLKKAVNEHKYFDSLQNIHTYEIIIHDKNTFTVFAIRH